MKRFLLLALMTGVLLISAAPTHSQDPYIRSPRLGINHISAPGDPIVDQRYRNALFLGAGWNRWALYWSAVEDEAGNYNWQGYDALVANDVRYGMQTDAIFLGIPAQHYDNTSIRGIYEPVFSDGSDLPGAGKTINPNNPYARFVAAAVQRYMPGGILAGQLGWQTGQGIRVWEAWNEPDLRMFWGASYIVYARLLKVTYLAVHQIDPLAQVMFAGLAYNNPDVTDYLAQTLSVISRDPNRAAFNWYFDIAAVHSYSDAERSARMVRRIKQTLTAYGLSRPVWLNESGVPVWDDYPGQTWTATNPGARLYRGTQQEQALYVVESTALAWAAGADVVFLFQLYDDCGNQASGTDFPPNAGQAGDAYGLFRNDRTATCFTQSPQPNTPRPAASAYYRMAQIFGSRNFTGGTRISLDGRGTAVAFDLQPLPGAAGFGTVSTAGTSDTNVVERVYVLWNRSSSRLVINIPASGEQAQLYDIRGEDYMLTPQDGSYEIGLPSVAASDYPAMLMSEIVGISGAPYVLVEQVQSGWTPVDPQMVRVQGTQTPQTVVIEVPTMPVEPVVPISPPPPTPIPLPTTNPALDHTAPIPLMLPLPDVSPAVFTVRWDGQDNSGIAGYIVWVRVNGGTWQSWLETTDTQADYTGTPGSTYEFALWAVDLAGNWSENVELSPQAVTRVQ